VIRKWIKCFHGSIVLAGSAPSGTGTATGVVTAGLPAVRRDASTATNAVCVEPRLKSRATALTAAVNSFALLVRAWSIRPEIFIRAHTLGSAGTVARAPGFSAVTESDTGRPAAVPATRIVPTSPSQRPVKTTGRPTKRSGARLG